LIELHRSKAIFGLLLEWKADFDTISRENPFWRCEIWNHQIMQYQSVRHSFLFS
jgi:hypothetical protein